jgi:hypothetical protein
VLTSSSRVMAIQSLNEELLESRRPVPLGSKPL